MSEILLSVCLGGSPARRVDGRKKAARCAGGGTPLAVFSADSTGFTSLNFEQFEQFGRFGRFDPFDRVVQIDGSAGSVKCADLGRSRFQRRLKRPDTGLSPGIQSGSVKWSNWIGQMVKLPNRPHCSMGRLVALQFDRCDGQKRHTGQTGARTRADAAGLFPRLSLLQFDQLK